MKRKMLRLFFLLALGPATAAIVQAQANTPAAQFAEPQAAEKANTHEDELYKAGTEALNNGDYDSAVSHFD